MIGSMNFINIIFVINIGDGGIQEMLMAFTYVIINEMELLLRNFLFSQTSLNLCIKVIAYKAIKQIKTYAGNIEQTKNHPL